MKLVDLLKKVWNTKVKVVYHSKLLMEYFTCFELIISDLIELNIHNREVECFKVINNTLIVYINSKVVEKDD